MGLDDFTSDDNSSSSNTSSSSTKTSKDATKDNTPTEATAGFHNIEGANPRGIKHQIKALTGGWRRQFSNIRFDDGELLMYSAGTNATKRGYTVMVFTTIQPITADKEPDETKDIWVVCWDFNRMKPATDGVYIGETSGWKTELYKAIEDQLDEVDKKS